MEWLTVKEAALRTGKSESAIKRLIYKLQKERPNAVKNEKNKYFVSVLELQNSGKTANERTTAANERTTAANEKPNDIFVSTLVAQLAEKDEQIKRLQIDADQKNKLIAHLQTQLQLPTKANDQPNERTTAANDQRTTNERIIIFLICVVLVLLVLVLITIY